MSIRRNVIANYAGQLYTTLISMVMVPLYLRYMGKEAYGLVGFFATLQVIFQLLDIGMTQTISREAARFAGGAVDASGLRRLLKALEAIFVGISILGVVLLLACSSVISTRWLKVQNLSLTEVQRAIELMAFIVAFRWISGLYRGVINGMERIVWLNCFNTVVNTIRFALIIPFFYFIGTTPTLFFSYQLVVAVVELLVLFAQAYRVLPKARAEPQFNSKWQPLRGVMKFSLSIAFTSMVWVMVTQTDKLVLSKLLPLAEYASFTLAGVVAGGILIISGPISGALLPRMTRLQAANDTNEMVRLYRNATQLVAVIAIPASLVLACFSEQVLYAWTGDKAIAHDAFKILTLYALGNGILVIRAFPYYLQYAMGNLRLHLLGSTLNIALLVPLLVWSTMKYGAEGAGYVWFGTNVLFFVFWTPLVHWKLVKGLHIRWLIDDIAPSCIFALIAVLLLRHQLIWLGDRIHTATIIVVIGLTSLAIAVSASSFARNALFGQAKKILKSR